MLKLAPLGLAVALLLSPAAALAHEPDAPACPSQDPAAVADTLSEMYAALSVDDAARFGAVTAPGFYSFDVGKRFDGMELAELVKTAHAAGGQYVWTVNEPQVRVVCDFAWITYVNQGSATKAGVTTPVTWLESAVLHHDGKRWRIDFFHSTRAQP